MLFRSLVSNFLQKYIFRVLNGVREKKSLAKIFCLCGIQNIWKEVWKGWLHLATLSSKNCILSTFANSPFDLNYLYIPSSLKSLESLKDGTIQDHIKENHSSKLYKDGLWAIQNMRFGRHWHQKGWCWGCSHFYSEVWGCHPWAQTAECDCNIVLECHTRNVQYLVCFGEKGKLLLSLSE